VIGDGATVGGVAKYPEGLDCVSDRVKAGSG
jgi:hypothetical protein